MPFYEYRCRNCGHEYEEFVRSLFSQARPVCPKCGSQESEKVVSLFGSTSSSSGSSIGAANCAPTGG
ncbi:MAG: zinc ribbon domain-containing protein [Anaerolineae bacterium]